MSTVRRAAGWAGGVDLALMVVVVVLAGINGNVARVVAMSFDTAFPIVALVILRVQPRNAVAWVFIGSTLLAALSNAGDELATYGLAHGWPNAVCQSAAWAQTWPWFPSIFSLLTVAILRFPNGRLLAAGWRWVERTSIVAMTVFSVTLGVSVLPVPARELMTDTNAPAPPGWYGTVFQIGIAMFPVIAVCSLASLGSLVVRYRRGSTVEREQTRWVLSAVVVAVVIETGLDLYGSYGANLPAWVQTIGEGVGFGLIAVATGVAITRYKLYEIDRILSRTVAYAVVVIALAALYTGVLVGLAALVPANLGQLGVAAATLVVSIVAVPLTRRVRRTVDRRFNRTRFDAERVAAAFARRPPPRPPRTRRRARRPARCRAPHRATRPRRRVARADGRRPTLLRSLRPAVRLPSVRL